MPIVGTAIFGFGFMMTLYVLTFHPTLLSPYVTDASHRRSSIPLQLYLVDAFTYAASALAAVSVSYDMSDYRTLHVD